MCGRFTLRPSWNVAPTQEVGVVLAGESGLTYRPMAWELVPFWRG